MAKKKKDEAKKIEELQKEINEIEDLTNDDIVVEKNEEKINPKKVRRQRLSRAFFIIWNLFSIIFYGVSSFISINRDFKHDIFTYIILGAVIVYVIVFGVIVITTSSNKRLAKNSISTYKTQIKIWRTFLGLFNLALTINILVNAFLNEKDGFVIALIIFGFIFVIIRILIAAIKLVILFFKQQKISKKRKRLKEKIRLKQLSESKIKA